MPELGTESLPGSMNTFVWPNKAYLAGLAGRVPPIWPPPCAESHQSQPSVKITAMLDIISINGDAAEISYFGGKNGAGVYQTIINQMPPHRVYVEPFLGGGAIMRLKLPAALNVGIDLDAGVIAGFRERGSALSTIADTARPEDTRRRRSSDPPMESSTVEHGEVGRYRWICGDAIAYLQKRRYGLNELVYCDPPYMHETRGRKDRYKFEMTDVDHRRFLRVALEVPAMVIISGYWTPLYATMLAAWNHSTFQTTNRAGQLTEEHLWFNYPAPVELHDYRYLGANFRERERIKRKKARWTAKLAKMPLLERQAIMGALAEAPVPHR